jgi:hypothetical protein
VAGAVLNANRQIGTLMGVAAMSVVLGTISDWNRGPAVCFLLIGILARWWPGPDPVPVRDGWLPAEQALTSGLPRVSFPAGNLGPRSRLAAPPVMVLWHGRRPAPRR